MRPPRGQDIERDRVVVDHHDIVTHHLATIAVLAAAAAEVIDDDSTQLRRSISEIRREARLSLDEMRRFIRQWDRRVADSPRSMPGIRAIPALAEQFGSRGLDVSVAVIGRVREVQVSVGFAIYRIVEDTLSGALGEGIPHAELRLVFDPGSLLVEIVASGREPTRPAGRGRELRFGAIRERVALFDGEFEVRSHRAGALRVRARIPTGSRRPTNRRRGGPG